MSAAVSQIDKQASGDNRPRNRPHRSLSRKHSRTMGQNERRTAWAMVSPTILVILAVAFLPVLETLYLSLHNSTVSQTGSFAGFSNYSLLLHDPIFRRALVSTAAFTILSVVPELVIGLAIALALNRRFRGRSVVRAVMLIPWAFPLSVAAVIGRLMLQDQVGIVSYLAHSSGLVHSPILSDPTLLLVALIAVDVWTSTPFMALLLLAGLQTIPQELINAARVDGASPVQRFFYITLPLLKPAMLVALLFRTLQAWAVYDLFYVMAQRQVDSLSTYVYEGVRVSELNFAPGTAAAVTIFLTSLGIALIYIKGFGVRTVQDA